jgi:hypothetical protein
VPKCAQFVLTGAAADSARLPRTCCDNASCQNAAPLCNVSWLPIRLPANAERHWRPRERPQGVAHYEGVDLSKIPTTTALAALERCRINLRAARVDALYAVPALPGARAARAAELAENLADALAHAERLCFIVEADARYEAQR